MKKIQVQSRIRCFVFNTERYSARDNKVFLFFFGRKEDTHHIAGTFEKVAAGRGKLTVDGNSHALVENEAIRALEGRDLAQLVELQVLGGGLGGVNLDDFELEIVGLRDRTDGGRARVLLVGVKLAESHLQVGYA